MCFFYLISVCICVCFYLIDCLFPSLSFFVIHSVFPHLFTCLCLEFYLSFSFSLVLVFFFPPKNPPLPPFLSVSLSPHYLSLSSGERSLTRSPWSSRVQWRASWVWWTTCPALSATTMRCPPSPASTAPTRRSIITRMMTHFLHLIRPVGLIPLPTCRAAQVIMRKWQLQWRSCCCNFWLLKNPEILRTLFFSFTQAKIQSQRLFSMRFHTRTLLKQVRKPLKDQFTQITHIKKKITFSQIEPNSFETSILVSILDIYPNPWEIKVDGIVIRASLYQWEHWSCG